MASATSRAAPCLGSRTVSRCCASPAAMDPTSTGPKAWRSKRLTRCFTARRRPAQASRIRAPRTCWRRSRRGAFYRHAWSTSARAASMATALERVRAGTPVLRAEDDVYTSHIHADDLAAAVVRALADDATAGTYNVADDTVLKLGDWLDLVAEHAGLPRPTRVTRAQMVDLVPEDLYSFMCESRRLDNRRMKQVLGVHLRYPTVYEGLRHEHTLGVD